MWNPRSNFLTEQSQVRSFKVKEDMMTIRTRSHRMVFLRMQFIGRV